MKGGPMQLSDKDIRAELSKKETHWWNMLDTFEDCDVIYDLIESNARTRIENRALKEHIKKHEWQARYQGEQVIAYFCPECGHREKYGHTPDCRTAKLLEGEA
jgi:hypothetical protein